MDRESGKPERNSRDRREAPSCLETPVVTRDFSGEAVSGESHRRKMGDRSDAHGAARALRKRLLDRLRGEEASDLVKNFQKCGERFELTCTSCGELHEAERRCSKKWCPVCVRRIATKRSLKFRAAVAAMKWPLFVTLTMRNVDDLSHDAVRKLRRAFGKLRGRKLWKAHVRGGAASIEVTNIGNGWHPHLHAILDCEWLAFKTPMPKASDSRERKRQQCKKAAQELERVWSKCLGQNNSSVKVKRTNEADVVQEVLKYSVKGSDLVESKDDVAPIIRCLEATRLVTTFGTLFGKKLIRSDADDRPPMMCKCGASGCFVPEEVVRRMARLTKPRGRIACATRM
jgi:plasmid rolling circle replication initiator protein Rep